MNAALFTLAAYLLGSIPFAIVVSRALRIADPRTYGSKNIGATNVLRSGNRLAALLTLAGDAGKGWLAVILARVLGAGDELIALVAIAAFVGHVFPVWLKFRGGKGVATAAGVLIAIDWRLGLAVLVVWLTVVVATRYSSLAAIVAALFAPLATWYLLGAGSILPAVIAMSAILVVRHRDNIAKLARGEERKIGV
jgi:glycerol-3-phosphate acyltransferase PlsY